ncbi:MFS transporter [Streptacidiphilus sp. 4-A2]|nr:MFS transporter [Streptacidiphilus sp. 4-A2]
MTLGDVQVGSGVRQRTTLRDYRLLLSAFVVSTAGDWLYKLALPLLVLSMTGSAIQTAVVYSLEYVPYLLFAMAGGVLSDRRNRRTLLICADSAAAGLVGALAVLTWCGQYQLWLIYPAAFLLSSITPLYQASFLAMLPSTVPAERLGWANSRMQTGQSALDLAGRAGREHCGGGGGALGTQHGLGLLRAVGAGHLADRQGRRAPPAARGRHRPGGPPRGAELCLEHPTLLWVRWSRPGARWTVHGRGEHAHLSDPLPAPVGGGGRRGVRRSRRGRAGRAVLAPHIGKRTVYPADHRLRAHRRLRDRAAAGAAPLAAIAAAWVVVGASTMVFIVTYYTLRHQLVPDHLLGRVLVITRVIAYVTVRSLR